MRNALVAIRKKLLSNQQLVAIIGDRIYPQHVTTQANPVFPCITISAPSSSTAAEYAGTRSVLAIDVWDRIRDDVPQGMRKGGYDGLAQIYALIKTELDLQTLADEKYHYFLQESGYNDQLYEESIKVYHLALKYTVEAITETFVMDAWASSLEAWLKPMLPNEWHITSASWVQTRQRPCIIIRLADYTVEQEGFAMVKQSKKFEIHIFGLTVNQQQEMARDIVEQIAGAYKIPIGSKEKRNYMTLSDMPQASLSVDPASNNGQIKFSCHRISKRNSEENVSVINDVNVSGHKFRREEKGV